MNSNFKLFLFGTENIYNQIYAHNCCIRYYDMLADFYTVPTNMPNLLVIIRLCARLYVFSNVIL